MRERIMGESQIIYRVALAVLVIDDFNNKILKGSSVQVKITDVPEKPIRKQDGYFVFTGDLETIQQIEVESPLYYKAVIKVAPKRLNPLHPVLKIRLQPNRLYGVPGGVTFLEGRGLPGTEIQVILENRAQQMKLLYDYSRENKDNSREIRLFQAAKKDLAGKYLAISGKEQQDPEIFQILEMTDPEQGVCILTEALSSDYKKTGTTIFPVYTAKTDDRGEYYLLLPGLEGKEPCPCLIKYKKTNAGETSERGPSLRGDIIPGQGNRLDLA